jgi:Protein of unknown function (DUF3396)
MEPQQLYKQDATHFTLRFFIKPDSTVGGQFVLELADTFLAALVFPGCRPTSMWTKAPGAGAKPAIGEFSERRWNTAARKLRANEYAVLRIEAQMPDFPNQKIDLYVHVNPPGGTEILQSGTIEVTCSVPYLRHLAASREKVEALLAFGTKVWNGVDGAPAYGFGNLAVVQKRPAFTPFAVAGTAPRLGPIAPPAERRHAIPVAHTGSDVDGNIDILICEGRGIKGAFWANYLSAIHVGMAGGESQLRGRLEGMRVEPLNGGGLLIVATDSPLPEDSEESRRRFLRLHAALQPAFLSRSETPERKRDLLGYFYREAPPVPG